MTPATTTTNTVHSPTAPTTFAEAPLMFSPSLTSATMAAQAAPTPL